MGVRVIGDIPVGHLERAMPHKLREDGLVSPAQYLSGGTRLVYRLFLHRFVFRAAEAAAEFPVILR